jgi:hypothetical protein
VPDDRDRAGPGVARGPEVDGAAGRRPNPLDEAVATGRDVGAGRAKSIGIRLRAVAITRAPNRTRVADRGPGEPDAARQAAERAARCCRPRDFLHERTARLATDVGAAVRRQATARWLADEGVDRLSSQ